MRKSLSNAKIVVTVEGDRRTKVIWTISAFDNRTQTELPQEYIEERGIQRFSDMDDMKETLNWNLNGDKKNFQFKWGMSSKGKTEGMAYIFQ